jgi:hypothetical protein
LVSDAYAGQTTVPAVVMSTAVPPRVVAILNWPVVNESAIT